VIERRSNLATFAVYAAALVHGLTVVSFPASAAILKSSGGLRDAQYGTIFIPQMLATILGSLFASRLGARAASLRMLAVSLGCAGAAAGLLLLVPVLHSFPIALAATFAAGLGFGLSAAPLNSAPRRLFPAHADSALVGLHTVLAGGFALGPLLVSWAIDHGAWSSVPSGVAVAAVGIALLSLAMPALRTETNVPIMRGTAGPKRSSFVFIAIVVLYALAEGTFANWGVIYLAEERGIAARWSTFALSLFWCALAIGRLAVSVLVVRFSVEAIWRTLPVLMTFAFLAMPWVSGPVTGLLCFAIAGLGCSAFFPLTVSLAAGRDGAARAGSILTAALMVGVGLGSFAIGPLRGGASLATLYGLSAIYPLSALALCTWRLLRVRSALEAS
jgi:predicted MFS family arabinose efflux permease